MFDGAPMPSCPECPVPGAVGSFLSFMLGYLLLATMVLSLLPKDCWIALLAFGKAQKTEVKQ